MKKRMRFSPEVRERTVRMVSEHRGEYESQWKAIESVAGIKVLEREVRELRQTKEILRKASACFAQAELDRPFKR